MHIHTMCVQTQEFSIEGIPHDSRLWIVVL